MANLNYSNFAYGLCCLTLWFSLEAGPEGFQLVAGDARPPISDGQGVTTIHSGKKAIVNWKDFSIGEKETVRFAQADTHSAILNRVVGFSDSKIYGQLLSNGKVFLVNKNGIVIGPHGRIETAAFVASTHDLLNEDFLKEREMTFKGFSENGVINFGTIEAIDGDILLIGNRVSNQGTLKAKSGHVGLATGQEVFVKPEGRERIFVRIPVESSENSEVSLEHSGTIQALSAELKSGARPYSKAIKFSGEAEMFSTLEEGGHIYLVAEEGVTEFSGHITAKEVRILGKEVYLQDQGHIDVSGEGGGGTVLIGGDYRGENTDVPNAAKSYIGSEVNILADAHVSGNGGKVIVWGNETTSFFGHISSRGGSEGGDGGLIEISGKYLDYRGSVDLQAAKGKMGLLYLDPSTVVIGAGGCAATFGTPTTWPIGCCPTVQIDAAALGTALAGANVTIDTSASTDCATAGTITITTPFSWATANTLTLISDSSMDFNLSGGAISGGGLSLTTRSGDLTVTDSNISMTGAITLDISGAATISSTIVSISELAAVGGVSGTISGDLSVLTTSGSAEIGGAVQGTGPINLTIGGNLTVTSSNGAGHAIIGYAGAGSVSGNITLDVAGSVNVNGLSNMRSARIGHSSSGLNSGNINVTSQTGSVNITSNNGGTGVIGYYQSRFGGTSPANTTVIAGTNVNLTTTLVSDSSVIGGLGLTSGVNVTVVSDNAFPSSSGPGGVTVSGPGTTDFIATTANSNQVSIYTVTPSQNTLPSTINTASFSPQPVGENNSYQEFNVFYPGGTYIGPEYMVFYKTGAIPAPSPPPTPAPVINTTTVANTAITNILTPTDTSGTTVLLGPASQTNSNDPVSDQTHDTPYNNDNRGGQQCH